MKTVKQLDPLVQYFEDNNIKNPKEIHFFKLYFEFKLPAVKCYKIAYGCKNDGSARVLASRLLSKVNTKTRLAVGSLSLETVMEKLQMCSPAIQVKYMIKLLGLDVQHIKMEGEVSINVIPPSKEK